jgi:low affinity Fe/Cu permease
MNKIYIHTERYFEKLAFIAATILGNSITFILSLAAVIFWFTNKKFFTQDIYSSIGDVILGLTFISLFIIQKSINRFSGSLHLKVNELVASHEPASNSVMNAEGKTEDELTELAKGYSELAEQTREAGEKITSNSQQIKVGKNKRG